MKNISYSVWATCGLPYGLCVDYNFISTVNYNKKTTNQRREQAPALRLAVATNFCGFRAAARAVPTGTHKMEMHAELSLPLTRKVARRRRVGRREAIYINFFGISPSVIFCYAKNDSSLVRGSLCRTSYGLGILHTKKQGNCLPCFLFL